MANRRTPDQQLAAETENALRAFIYYPSQHFFTVNTLWTIGTHFRRNDGSFIPETYARMMWVSKVPGAGKTHAMTISSKLSFNGEVITMPTSHGLVTLINNDAATPYVDETDKLFGNRGTAKQDQQLIINNGYKVGAYVPRQRNDETERLNTHGPMGLGGKNYDRVMRSDVFDTLRTRSIILPMERKPIGHPITKYRARIHDAMLSQIRKRITRWAQTNGPAICRLNVDDICERAGLDNRDEEIWYSLFQIAEFLGGEWPGRIMLACRAFVFGEWEDDTPILSPAEELLSWVRAAFDEDTDFIKSRDLIQFLMSDAVGDVWWRREWRTPKAASMGLANQLATFGIEADRTSIHGEQVRGYWRDDCGVDNLDNLDNLDDLSTTLVDASAWEWEED